MVIPEVEGEWTRVVGGQGEWVQALSLLQNYCGSYGQGEYRDAWHRRQFELIYRDWHKGTHTEEVMKEVGGNSVRVWQSKGGVGSSLWWKGALISKEEYYPWIKMSSISFTSFLCSYQY